MPRLWLAAPLFLLCSLPLSAQTDTKEPAFPTESEIKLLLTQAERAVASYELAIKAQETGNVGSDLSKDREILTAFQKILPNLKATPNLFNTSYGFALVVELDGASRNIDSCMSLGMANAATNPSGADRQIHLAETCAHVGVLLNTVSETAMTLYQKYLAANDEMQRQQQDAIDKCLIVMKTHCSPSSEVKK